MKPRNLNDKAEQLLQNANYKDALSTFQQVFLSHGKSEDSATQIEVARALRGAIYCLQQQNQTEKAAQILATLERRFGQSNESQVRRYLELARSGDANFENSEPASNFEPITFDDAEFDFDDIEAQLAQAHQASSPAETSRGDEAATARASRLIAEEHVSLASIEQVLEQAFIKCEITADEVIRVREDGPIIIISINPTNQLLRFCAYYGLRKYADVADKWELANKINDGYVLVRASIDDETTLSIDAYLVFKGGVLPVHIVAMLRLMGRIIPAALRESDADDILT